MVSNNGHGGARKNAGRKRKQIVNQATLDGAVVNPRPRARVVVTGSADEERKQRQQDAILQKQADNELKRQKEAEEGLERLAKATMLSLW